MSSWSQFEAAAPEFAAEVRGSLDAHKHKALATLRRDGSPRVSGSEAQILEGELWIGSMWQARKAHDLQRDPRFALHSGSDDPATFRVDAKLSGVVEEIVDAETVQRINGAGGAPPGPSHLFRLDLHEISTAALAPSGRAMVISVWKPGEDVRTFERA